MAVIAGVPQNLLHLRRSLKLRRHRRIRQLRTNKLKTNKNNG
jgi:hypothetical protein